MRPRPSTILVSELYPPAVGGSAELFGNIYGRFGSEVLALIEQAGTETAGGRVQMRSLPRSGLKWGVLNPAALATHVARAAIIRRHARGVPAVVHCGRIVPEGIAARLAMGPPFVCWVHGEELAFATKSRELRWLSRTVARSASLLIANSRNTAAFLDRAGVKGRAVEVVHPGVDVDRFRPELPGAVDVRSRSAPNGELLLLTVGRLQRRKGHDTVLHVLRLLIDSGRPVRYLVVGDGEERPRLERLCAELGLADRVTFAGRVVAADLPAWYAAADIFVHPNREDRGDFEGFGIVFLEAAAAGLAVIAGRSGGVPEAVADRETGVLVSGTDPAEVAKEIAELADNPERRLSMGRAGRARVVREFTWDRAARQVAELDARIRRERYGR